MRADRKTAGLALVMTLSVALAAASLAAAPEAAAPPAKEAEARELTGHVYVLFEKKCKSCHGADLKKPEGDFGYVLDLARLTANLEMVVKGDAAKSELYQRVKDGEMPPSDSKVPPLTAEEKELVRRWIAAGAPATLPAKLPTPKNEPARTDAPKPLTLAEQQALPAVVAMREKARQARVTLDIKDQPAGEAFAEVAKAAGMKVAYAKPAQEPRVSIRLKNGTAFQALEYLALSGNFSLLFDEEGALIGPNPPRDPPKPKEAPPQPADAPK